MWEEMDKKLNRQGKVAGEKEREVQNIIFILNDILFFTIIIIII